MSFFVPASAPKNHLRLYACLGDALDLPNAVHKNLDRRCSSHHHQNPSEHQAQKLKPHVLLHKNTAESAMTFPRLRLWDGYINSRYPTCLLVLYMLRLDTQKQKFLLWYEV